MSENTSYTAELDEEARSRVVALVEQGKMHLKKSADEIIEFGKVLIQLKELLPHGQFMECVENEYGITDATANNYMNVAKRLSDKSQMILICLLLLCISWLLRLVLMRFWIKYC